MAGERGARALRLLRRARQLRSGGRVLRGGDQALVSGAAAPQPAHQPHVGAHEPSRGSLAPARQDHASLAQRALRRQYPRQEPRALAVHAGICAGGSPSPQGEGLSLPRLLDLDLKSFFDSVPHDLVLQKR